MVIYEACYNECTYESAYQTISLHRTYEGARKAIKNHRRKLVKENRKNTIEYKLTNPEAEAFKIQSWQQWKIFETELKD